MVSLILATNNLVIIKIVCMKIKQLPLGEDVNL